MHFVEKMLLLTEKLGIEFIPNRGWPDPDLKLFIPDPDPDPAKGSGSDRIRIGSGSTTLNIWLRRL